MLLAVAVLAEVTADATIVATLTNDGAERAGVWYIFDDGSSRPPALVAELEPGQSSSLSTSEGHRLFWSAPPDAPGDALAAARRGRVMTMPAPGAPAAFSLVADATSAGERRLPREAWYREYVARLIDEQRRVVPRLTERGYAVVDFPDRALFDAMAEAHRAQAAAPAVEVTADPRAPRLLEPWATQNSIYGPALVNYEAVATHLTPAPRELSRAAQAALHPLIELFARGLLDGPGAANATADEAGAAAGADWRGERARAQHWVGTGTFGPREYGPGATLAMHVDIAATNVVSVVLHVGAAGGDAAWPLAIVDHANATREITLRPGEALLYESARCAHGRPRPFAGDRYANWYAYFRPAEGWPFARAQYATIGEYCDAHEPTCALPPPGTRLLRQSGGHDFPAWRLYDPRAEEAEARRRAEL